MIITIDGPTATGKSTIAKKLAKQIGFIYFDTGAIYRSLAYDSIQRQLDFNNPKDLEKLLETFDFEIRIIDGEPHYMINGEDASLAIRTPEVTAVVSQIATLAPIRQKLYEIQRANGKGVDAVFEGRDMGTTVFPSADTKIFLTAQPEVRAERRFKEFREKFPEKTKELTLEKTLEEINQRDQRDTTRKHSPLRQADDAHVIDTSNLSIDEVVLQILEYTP